MISYVSRLGYIFLFFLLAVCSQADDTKHFYSTGSRLEIDRCASAWLILRHIDPSAQFKFFPEGDLITSGIPFDTPDAELRRTHNLSTYEVILDKYDIKDSKLIKLGHIVHELEINFWSSGKSKISIEVGEAINSIIGESKSNEDCLKKCFAYFDKLIVDF
jgi:hypothetical protein